jgi:hypothetical protein
VETINDLSMTELRAQRHRVNERVARLAWLRRVVAARSDLEVARLADLRPEPGDLGIGVNEALVLQSLALSTPGGPELLRALQLASRSLGNAVDDAHVELDALTHELVDRYAADPAHCLRLTQGRPA